MSETVKVKKGHGNIYNVSLNVTQGKVLALMNALNRYVADTGSPVAQDLLEMLRAANAPE